MAKFGQEIPKEYSATQGWHKGHLEIKRDGSSGWGIDQYVADENGLHVYPLGYQDHYSDAVREASVHSRARGNLRIMAEVKPYDVKACHKGS